MNILLIYPENPETFYSYKSVLKLIGVVITGSFSFLAETIDTVVEYNICFHLSLYNEQNTYPSSLHVF